MIKYTVSLLSLLLTLSPFLPAPGFALSDKDAIPLDDGHEDDADLNAALEGEGIENESNETPDDSAVYDESTEVIVNEETLNRVGEENGGEDPTPDVNDT